MPWAKGQSGNPGGEIKGKQKQIAEKLIEHVDAAVAKLVAGLDDPDNYITAAKDILDRVYGKPKQALEHDATEKVVNMILKIADKNVP